MPGPFLGSDSCVSTRRRTAAIFLQLVVATTRYVSLNAPRPSASSELSGSSSKPAPLAVSYSTYCAGDHAAPRPGADGAAPSSAAAFASVDFSQAAWTFARSGAGDDGAGFATGFPKTSPRTTWIVSPLLFTSEP